jgi:hypothetical protein
MADEKKVRLGVDPGDTESALRRLKSSSEEMFRGMIASSRAYSTSAREVLSDLNAQIAAIEKRNRLETESRRVNLQERYDKGEISERQLRSGKQQIAAEGKEDKLQTQLLRELIDTIKIQAKEEIRENRQTVEKRIQASKTVGTKGAKGDEKELLKETIQEYELGRIGQEEIQQRGMFAAGRRGLPYLSGIAGSSNVYDAGVGVAQTGFGRMSAAGGALGFLGGLGVIAAMAGGKAIQASLPYEQARGRMAGLTGRSMESYEGFGESMDHYGYTMDEALARRFTITKARGTGRGAGQATIDAMMLERGLSLEPGQIDAMERLQRGEKSGLSTRGNVQAMIGSMRGAGVVAGSDTTKVSEYLEIIASIGNEQLKKLGNLDTGINTRMVTGIASLDQSLKSSPEYLKEVVSSIRTGLTTAPTKQAEALQYAVLSKAHPEMSIGQLKIEREKGQYFGLMNEALMGMSGNLDIMQEMNVGMYPGLSEKTARMLAEKNPATVKAAMERTGEFDPNKGVNLEGRAVGATGILTTEIAKWTNGFMTTGTDLVKALDSLRNGMVDVVDKIKKLTDDVAENRKATMKIGETLIQSNSIMDKLNGTLIYTSQTLPMP